MNRKEMLRAIDGKLKGQDSQLYKSGAFSGYTDFRYGGSTKPITLAGSLRYHDRDRSDPVKLAGTKAKPILTGAKRKGMAERVERLFQKDWRSSPFENEGSIRHGLRSSFCLAGYSWRQSDNEAEWLTETAIRSLGLRRPSFMEGQRDYAGEHDYCSWCQGPIDEEGRTRLQRFCSTECATMALAYRSRAIEEHDGGVRRSASRLLAKAKAPPRDCHYCGTSFRSDREDAQFCSVLCSTRWSKGDRLLKDIVCEGCGKTSKPVNRGQRFCSLTCRSATLRDRDLERLSTTIRVCQCCGKDYTPTADKSMYCSTRCASRMANRAYKARKKAEKTLHHFACHCCGEGFTTTIPWAKFCDRTCAGVVKKVDEGKLRWIAPRPFDYMIRQAGARVTTDFRAAA